MVFFIFGMFGIQLSFVPWGSIMTLSFLASLR